MMFILPMTDGKAVKCPFGRDIINDEAFKSKNNAISSTITL